MSLTTLPMHWMPFSFPRKQALLIIIFPFFVFWRFIHFNMVLTYFSFLIPLSSLVLVLYQPFLFRLDWDRLNLH